MTLQYQRRHGSQNTAAAVPRRTLGRALSSSAENLHDLGVEHRTDVSATANNGAGTPSRLQIKVKRGKGKAAGLGLNIRGGSEFGLDIFVSAVDAHGTAAAAGLQAGDQIISVNGISLSGATHSFAVEQLKYTRTVRLEVVRTGAVPRKASMSREAFTWVSPSSGDRHSVQGRPPAPSIPQPFGIDGNEDTKRVNFMVDPEAGLGISIRGGADQRLGIYISAVSEDGSAASAGLAPGDMIVACNGEDFTRVTHARAVEILGNSTMLMLTVRSGQPLPRHKYFYDEIEWEEVGTTKSSSSETAASPSAKAAVLEGFQVRLQRAAMASVEASLLQSSMVTLLSPAERTEINALLEAYRVGALQAPAFAGALLGILDSDEKMGLLTELRSVVRPLDIEVFDRVVSRHEVGAARKRTLRRPPAHSQKSSTVIAGTAQLGASSKGSEMRPSVLDLSEAPSGNLAGSSTTDVLDLVVPPPPEFAGSDAGDLMAVATESTTDDTLMSQLALASLPPAAGVEPSCTPTTATATPPPAQQQVLALSPTPDLSFLHDMLSLADAESRPSAIERNGHFFRRKSSSKINSSGHGNNPNLNRISYIHADQAVTLESPIGVRPRVRRSRRAIRDTLYFDQELIGDRQVYLVRVRKDDAPLGMTIHGGCDTDAPSGGIRVRGMRERGAAALDGRLQVGDEILQVNSISLQGCSHDEAVAALVTGLQQDIPHITLHIAR